MSVIAFVGSIKGNLEASAIEVISVASSVASKLASEAIVVATSEFSKETCSKMSFGEVKKVYRLPQKCYEETVLSGLVDILKQESANICLFNHDAIGKTLAPRLAVRYDAAFASGITKILDVQKDFSILKRNIYSGKAVATIKLNLEKQVWTVLPNSFDSLEQNKSTQIQIIDYQKQNEHSKVEVIETSAPSSDVSLTDAEIVVSAGRGLGGPEHWEMVEDLAKVLKAALACSRPVADSGWRPHHEHVGQTGIVIRPNLYIAIAISGATQHLAGVNGSKTIVVINKDPDAPFFNSANYGIVGDAFEVVPKITELIKKHYS